MERTLSGLAAGAVTAILIIFLALSNGGADPIARGEVGIVVWWVVLVATALGFLPPAGRGRAAMLVLGVATAFAAWTAVSFTWTESEERTATELARVSTYLGVLALALAAQGGGRWRHILHGVTVGVVVVCILALLSRMHPGWFPEQIAGRYLPGIEIESRLAYPLNYSSGLGALAAIALPLSLAGSASARTLAGQAASAAAIPAVLLTLWLTASGLSVPVAAVGLITLLALAPDRLPKLGILAAAVGGAAILLVATEQRDAFDLGLATSLAETQGHEMLALTVGVCLAVGLVQVAVGLWVRHARRPRWLRVSRRQAAIATAVVATVVVVGAVAAGAPGRLADEWQNFKTGDEGSNPADSSRGAQILDFSSSGRYNFWESAVDANATDPWVGIGPGTFELWWARNGTAAGYVRDAHSLYVETLGELGIVGLVVLVAFAVSVLALGVWRAMTAASDLRLGLAAATAAAAAFLAAAAVDWVWELAVLPLVFFIVAAIACAGGAEARSRRRHSDSPWRRQGGRVATVVLSLAGLAAIAQPLWGAIEMERSYDAAAESRLDDALDDARDAESAQPYAATPRMQQALLLEHRGDDEAAERAARQGTEREPTNWLTWFILSEVEREAGLRDAAAAHRRRADSLIRVQPLPE